MYAYLYLSLLGLVGLLGSWDLGRDGSGGADFIMALRSSALASRVSHLLTGRLCVIMPCWSIMSSIENWNLRFHRMNEILQTLKQGRFSVRLDFSFTLMLRPILGTLLHHHPLLQNCFKNLRILRHKLEIKLLVSFYE